MFNSQALDKTDNAMTATALDTTVLELLASRICHDLISPVGAVNNGVEFLQEMGADAGDEAIELIAYSAGQATAKLQAFRLAYGAGGRDMNIKPEDVHKTFGELIGNEGRVSQEWDPFAPIGHDEIPTGFCKVLMGALILALESMPKGGVIRVMPGDTAGETLVIAQGPGASPRTNMPQALNRTLPVSELDPRLVHAFVLSAIAAQYGFIIRAEADNTDSMVLRLSQN